MRPSSCNRTNTSVTARDSSGSMVNLSRDQSANLPSRRIWRQVMVLPDSAFHFQTRSTKASRPRSETMFALGRNWRSTTICVAMPA